MNKWFCLLALMLGTSPAFARSLMLMKSYSCGQLQYRGSTDRPVGGPRYTVIKNLNTGAVYLETKPMNPTVKAKRELAQKAMAGGEIIRYATGEMTISFVYNMRARQTQVSIHRTTNYDWHARCQ